MNILIVEDDLNLSEALQEILKSEKYAVDAVFNGQDGLDYGRSTIYDLIILDIMLPKMSGFEVIKLLRKNNVSTPIILLTARSEIADRVAGLDFGADDYLTKPFSTEELLARLRALARRPGDINIMDLSYGDITLSLSSRTLSNPEKKIQLSYKEFHLMQLLMANVGNIVSKEDMIVKIWGIHSEANDNNVEAYISFLRKKLKYLGTNVTIQTKRKVGYRLEVSHV